MEIVLPILRSLKHEKSAKRKLSPGRHLEEYLAQIFTTDYSSAILHGSSKKHRVLVSFGMKTAEMPFSKHASTLNVAMVTKGGRRRLKTKLLFFNLIHLNCQKVSSP